MEQEQQTLYHHVPHPHHPRNVNEAHAKERQSLNDRIAVLLTHIVGSMPTAYLFVLLAVIGLLGILGLLSPIVILLVAWTSQTLIQLALLPVIMVGQNVLSRHSELMAEEQFNTTMKSEQNIEQVMAHLDAQDAKILEIVARLEQQKH